MALRSSLVAGLYRHRTSRRPARSPGQSGTRRRSPVDVDGTESP
jgi:hypothetical protein